MDYRVALSKGSVHFTSFGESAMDSSIFGQFSVSADVTVLSVGRESVLMVS